MRDFNINDKHKHNYPDYSMKTIYFDLMSNKEIEDYMFERFKLIDRYIDTDIDKIPPCSRENRFNNGDEYALHLPLKSGKGYRKRAQRVMKDKEKLIQYAKKHNYEDYKIELREGINKKCRKYCDVNNFCNFYNEVVKPKL